MVGYNDSGKQIAKHGFTDERASLWGISALGLQLWNSIRVVDFLQSLPDVDADRIGCTGASGGGTQTFLLCAVDDRVKVAAPVNMISNHMQGGCVCENAPCLRFDTNNMEIGATMAPRPLLMVSATGDWTKNTPKVEFPAIREIYKLYGAEDKVATVQFQAEHNYNRDSREAVYRFFGKWLLGRDDMAEYKEPPYPKEKDEDLLVFAGRPLPAGALPNTEAVVEQCVAAAKKQLESLKHPADPASAKQARDTLREAFRLAMGATPLTAADVGLTLAGDPGIQTGFEINRRRGTFVPVLFFRSPSAAESATAPMTILVHEKGGGQAALVAPHGRPSGEVMWKLLDAGQVVCAIDAFGTGDSVGKQDPKQPRGSTKFFTTFNRTDTAERVWDFVTVVNSFVYGAEMSGRDEVRAAGLPRATQVNLIGIGEGGAWCALACASLGMKAAGGPAVRVVIDADQIDTSSEEAYLKHLYVPGILRAGGLPAAVSLILPARLMLHNTGDRFDTSWLKDLGMPVKIVNERASDDEIVAWLTERR
jgi:dienelactone hydrolase